MIHAAGAIEAIIVLESIRRGRVHPTINRDTPDPECDLDYVPEGAREVSLRWCLNNSLGFGGQNAVAGARPLRGGVMSAAITSVRRHHRQRPP